MNEKTSKTILIGMWNEYPAETKRWLCYLVGIILIGFSMLFANKHSFDHNNIIMFGCGIYLLI